MLINNLQSPIFILCPLLVIKYTVIEGIKLINKVFLVLVCAVLVLSGTRTVFYTAVSAIPTSSSFIYLPLIWQRDDHITVMPDGQASWGSTIVLSPSGQTLWVTNPDAGTVTALTTMPLKKVVEIPVGQEPWSLAISTDGRWVYIVDRALGTFITINTQSYQVETSIPIGAEPGAVALNPTGSRAYVSLTSAAEIAVVDTERSDIIAYIPVAPKPYAVAITDDGDSLDEDEQVYVSHFLALPHAGAIETADDSREGRITVIDTGSNSVVNQITLLPDEHGFPNLLAGIAIVNNRAWIPQVRAAPDLPQTLSTTVFAAVSVLDLDTGIEDVTAHLPLNDQSIFGSPVNNPIAVIPAHDGQTLYIVLAGSDLIEVVDISNPQQPQLRRFLATGHNPRGLALSPNGRWGYVMNYLSRSLTVLDLEQLTTVAEIPITSETLSPEVLQGKILFNNASDPQLSLASWISCASCHPDGGTDGVTWMFPDGPRQSPPLWYAGQTAPWHWSAALDELQDVEETLQLIQHGLGLAPGTDPPQLGSPNTGRTADLDALAAFMAQGLRVPAPPPTNGDLELGRSLFQATGCTTCHGGPTWTSSLMPGPAGTLDPDGNGMVDEVLRDVGTYNTLDNRGETGFDPPSLLGAGLTAPYLHDGSMSTLENLLASGHPDPEGVGNGLSTEEIASLATFLRSIGPDTVPIED